MTYAIRLGEYFRIKGREDVWVVTYLRQGYVELKSLAPESTRMEISLREINADWIKVRCP